MPRHALITDADKAIFARRDLSHLEAAQMTGRSEWSVKKFRHRNMKGVTFRRNNAANTPRVAKAPPRTANPVVVTPAPDGNELRTRPLPGGFLVCTDCEHWVSARPGWVPRSGCGCCLTHRARQEREDVA